MYTNRTLIEQYLGNDTDFSGIDSFVTTVIGAVKSYIDVLTGTTFEGASSLKLYDGDGANSVFVDPFTGTPSLVRILEDDGSVVATLVSGAANDYLAYPLNSTVKNEILLTGNGQLGRLGRGQRLEVTATFGDTATVPADVQLAATMLAAKVLQNNIPVDGQNKQSESLGDYSVTYATNQVSSAAATINAELLLAPYIQYVI